MADPEALIPLIYHETQQPGSMLCAQHALNSLLQGNYFTAPDLSELAEHLDQLERSYSEDIRGQGSANMDDTGFFSVQVLENALHVWGLSLVRWRSEAMQPYNDHPHTQIAFVLNQNQHWYTLRRFGSFGETGHWFNLDSSRPSPQWISKTYLGMFLQQAEHDGYSTFVVVPIDPSNSRPLPRSDADDVASTLPDSSSSAPPTSSSGPSAHSQPEFADEDLDLQAALQASLANTQQRGSTTSSSIPNRPDDYPEPVIPSSRTFPGFPPAPTPSTRGQTSGRQSTIPPNQDRFGNADLDPVSASMERNRVIMERMRQEQEAALRERYEEEIARFGRSQTRQEQPEAVEDDELFLRAMRESLQEHQARTVQEGEIVELDEDNDDYHEAPTNVHSMDRVYDDDDAELQAALKASLESVPAGFTLPPDAPSQPPQRSTNEPLASGAAPVMSQTVEESETETETETETEPDAEGAMQPVTEEVSIEEMRRRRLARFGG